MSDASLANEDPHYNLAHLESPVIQCLEHPTGKYFIYDHLDFIDIYLNPPRSPKGVMEGSNPIWNIFCSGFHTMLSMPLYTL